MKGYCHTIEKEQEEQNDRLKCIKEGALQYNGRLVVIAQMYSPRLDKKYTSVPGFRVGFQLLKTDAGTKEISFVEPINQKSEEKKELEKVINETGFTGPINYW